MGNVNAALLIVGILFVTGLSIGLLFWITKSGVISGKARTPVRVIGFLSILFMVIFLFINLRNISTPDRWVNLALTAGLVGMTALYASLTFRQAVEMGKQAEAAKQQADASLRMAEEMREQRYDAIRPVIDILCYPDTGTAAGSIADLMSSGLTCVLRNIGVGPAIDVYSFVQSPNRQRLDFGTLTIEQHTSKIALSLTEEGDKKALVVYYKDVYGHDIESSRELMGNEGDWKTGPLRTHLIDKGAKPQ